MILDTNLFVLLVVGTTDRSLIQKHKRTRGYTILDFQILRDYLENFQIVVTTPNILSETSNLLRQCDEKTAHLLSSTLGWFIGNTNEVYVASIKVAGMPCMRRLGITDCAILELLDGSTTLITTDFALYKEALRIDPTVKNFNHLRDEFM